MENQNTNNNKFFFIIPVIATVLTLMLIIFLLTFGKGSTTPPNSQDDTSESETALEEEEEEEIEEDNNATPEEKQKRKVERAKARAEKRAKQEQEKAEAPKTEAERKEAETSTSSTKVTKKTPEPEKQNQKATAKKADPQKETPNPKQATKGFKIPKGSISKEAVMALMNKMEEQQEEEMIVDTPSTETFTVVVNSKRPLLADYNPGENPVAKKALTKLMQDMNELGFSIGEQYDGFRSYEQQAKDYQKYVDQYGQEAAERNISRPGYSEKQTGLAFELFDGRGNHLGQNARDGAAKWLANNAHRYGFVIRYPSGKENVTGFNAKPHFIRFVGNDAVKIYQRKQTLEEFYGAR